MISVSGTISDYLSKVQFMPSGKGGIFNELQLKNWTIPVPDGTLFEKIKETGK